MTVYYPPGWDGAVEPNGEIVGGGAARVAPPPSPAPGGPAPQQVLEPLRPPDLPVAPQLDPRVQHPSPHQPPPPPAAPERVSSAVFSRWRRANRTRRSRGPDSTRLRAVRPVALLVGLLVVGAVGIAVDQNLVAKKWQHNERVEASRSQVLSGRLTQADASIESLSSQVTSLQGHVSHLNSELSAAANAKEKALDQNTVLTRLATDAGNVSDALSICVDDMQSLIGEIGQDIGSSYYDPYLEGNASAAGNACANAQSANAAVQAELNGG